MSGRIRDADVVTVRERASLVEIVGERVQLRPAGGGRLKGLCPFHDEKSPSFSVNPQLGFYHCLAGETRVLTWDGAREIRDLAGGTHRILGRTGNWQDAPFRSFGRQRLYEVTLSRNGQHKIVRATSGHRWFVTGGKDRTAMRELLTTELRPEHRLVSVFPKMRVARTEPSPFGIAAGITFGDGTLEANGSHALLCGEKDAQLLKWFPLSRTRMSDGNLWVLDLPKSFKSRPSMEESTSFLYGWLAGYLAADGHVAKDGTIMLNSARLENLQFVRDLCLRLGIATFGITTQMRSGFPGREPSAIHRIHLINDTVTAELFLLAEHRDRFEASRKSFTRSGWTVRSVALTDDTEEVFCAEVEQGHAFVLEDNLLTGNCFGCGESGDVITFLRQTEHLSFVEAIELLAGRFGIELTYERGSAAAGRQSSQRTRFVEANKVAAAFFTEQLGGPSADVARQFLAERGFDREAAATYGLGYAPAGWDTLTKLLRTKGFSDAELVGSGLSSEGRRGPIDRFRNRLVWPITEMTGEVVGFGARKLSTDPADDSPKYLNTPETALYRKSHVLYGLDKAKKDIARSRQAVVVEGYTDVMACHLAGVPTAVATCGTAFGTDHIALLRRMLMDSTALSGEVIFLFDGDAAGQKAALKAFDNDQSFVTQTFIAVSPDGSDPCELRLAKGDDAVRDLVASRVPLVEFALRSVLERYDLETAEGRVGALSVAAPFVAKIKDRALRPEYARRLAGWLGLDVEVVTGRVAELTGGRGAPPPRRPAPSQRPVDAAALTVEREVIKLAVQAPVLVAPLLDSIDGDAWTDPALKAVRELIEVAGGVTGQPGGEGWVELLREVADQDVVRDMVLRLAVEPIFCDGDIDDRYAAGQLARLQELAFGRRIAVLKPSLQRVNPVTEAERYTRMFTELVQLEQAMRAVRERGVSDL